MVKSNFPRSKFTSATGRALPEAPTKEPTKVRVPESFTSNQEGVGFPSTSMVISQRPINSLGAVDCCTLEEEGKSDDIAFKLVPKANRPLNPRIRSLLCISVNINIK